MSDKPPFSDTPPRAPPRGGLAGDAAPPPQLPIAMFDRWQSRSVADVLPIREGRTNPLDASGGGWIRLKSVVFADLVLGAGTQLESAAIAPDPTQRRFFRTRAWAMAREARTALAEAAPHPAGARDMRELHARGRSMPWKTNCGRSMPASSRGRHWRQNSGAGEQDGARAEPGRATATEKGNGRA